MLCRAVVIGIAVVAAAGCADPHGRAESVLAEAGEVARGIGERYASLSEEVDARVGPLDALEECPQPVLVPPVGTYSRPGFASSPLQGYNTEHRENALACYRARLRLVRVVGVLDRRVANHAPEVIEATLADVRRRVALTDPDALTRLLDQTEELKSLFLALYELPGAADGNRRYNLDLEDHAHDVGAISEDVDEALGTYTSSLDRCAELRRLWDAAVEELNS